MKSLTRYATFLLLLGSAVAHAACVPAPLGETEIYLRGSMNNWGVVEGSALKYQCDAYYVNVKALGRHDFKIADDKYSPSSTIGAPHGASTSVPVNGARYAAGIGSDPGSVSNLHANFTGAHTVRLAFDKAMRPYLSIGPKTFVDASIKPITDPVVLSLAFDSRDPTAKSPFGAAPAGTEMSFNLSALPGVSNATLVVELRSMEGNQENLHYKPVARIPMRKSADGKRERWSATHTFPAIGIYGYYFETVVGGKTYIYQNNDDVVYWTREAGSNGVGVATAMPAKPASIRRFRQTIHRADFKVPAWASDAVYYYIFPERFRNGDPRNDPRPETDSYQGHAAEFHKNWLERPFRPGSGDGSDDSPNNDFFGGDLKGIIDKLDYIAGLGVNTIYMTPIFTASSNHKYDTADYRNIDPRFGTNADFERLAKEAKRRGMRVIVDASFNHSGSDSIYFDRFGRYAGQGAFDGGKIRPGSPYASWYSFDSSKTRPEEQYKGWVGVMDLPELNKMSPDFRRFAFGAPDSVTHLWLKRGASGWRMDVAPWVPDDFWREWRSAVKAYDPQALTIAETWFDASKYFLGDSFDSTMNYILRNAILDYAAGGDARVIYRNVELMREAYPPQAFHALMNLLSTHDQPRSLHHLGYQSPSQGPDALALAKRRLRLALFFQMTFPGAPSVYYGDEVGVDGGEDPYNRATYPWPDLGGKPDEALLAEYKALIRLRHDTPVLRHGRLSAPLLVDEHVIALVRQDGAQWALTLTNNQDAPRTVQIALPAAMHKLRLKDARTGQDIAIDGGKLTVTVPALSGRALLSH
ncbi:MAG TPA: alpha-amylase family glycosyl hydrolase [Telluria sp.]